MGPRSHCEVSRGYETRARPIADRREFALIDVLSPHTYATFRLCPVRRLNARQNLQPTSFRILSTWPSRVPMSEIDDWIDESNATCCDWIACASSAKRRNERSLAARERACSASEMYFIPKTIKTVPRISKTVGMYTCAAISESSVRTSIKRLYRFGDCCRRKC